MNAIDETPASELASRTDGPVVDVATLAVLLHETEQHHGPYEASAPKHDWWHWYAAYLDARLRGSTSVEASIAARRYMEEVRHVVA